MIFRVYALYRRSLPIIIFLMILWAAQIAIAAMGLHTGYSEFMTSHILILVLQQIRTGVPLPPVLVGNVRFIWRPYLPAHLTKGAYWWAIAQSFVSTDTYKTVFQANWRNWLKLRSGLPLWSRTLASSFWHCGVLGNILKILGWPQPYTSSSVTEPCIFWWFSWRTWWIPWYISSVIVFPWTRIIHWHSSTARSPRPQSLRCIL